MAKSSASKTVYSCQNCGYNSHKWLGRCPSCEQWSSFVEERAAPADTQAGFRESIKQSVKGQPKEKYTAFESTDQEEEKKRFDTSMKELNRVLGGGLVHDSFVLVGGDPGIGKSTLLLQMAHGLIAKNQDIKILYVSGEESLSQIKGRSSRLGVKGQQRLFFAAETELEQVTEILSDLNPQILIMDSLQTFSTNALESAPGSVGQLREVSARLMMLAKSKGIAIWVVGHVTKDGSIAGPKVVEHMVDTVLYFEGDGTQNYRLLRTVKNRFGSSRELGVFEMDGEGLREVDNPSALFLGDRKNTVPGTATSASLEGSRPLLVELQALVVPSPLAMPRRTAVGLEYSRLSLIAAILERHLSLPLAQRDLFFNVSGGLKLSEPACDLGSAAAIWSSFEDQAMPPEWIWIGELGLTGEVRRVPQIDARLDEGAKLGFKLAVVPKGSKIAKGTKIECLEISRIHDLRSILK